MFDNITATSAKRKTGTSMVVSILLHGAVIAAAFLFAYARAHMPKRRSMLPWRLECGWYGRGALTMRRQKRAACKRI